MKIAHPASIYQVEGLTALVDEYLTEMDNPVPDPLYRRTLRQRLAAQNEMVKGVLS